MLRCALILLALLTASAQSAKEPEPKPYDVQEAYQVYAAALALDHATGELLIADATVPFKHCLDSHSDKLTKEAINHYKRTNETHWRLQQKFTLDQKYKLLSSKEIEQLRKPDPDGGFFWRFPRGVQIIHFSAVGFSADRTVAFAEMDVSCGGLCGHGRPFVLRRRNGKWSEYNPVIQHQDGTMEFSSACSWNY